MLNEKKLYDTVEKIKKGDLVELTRDYFTDEGELKKGETLRLIEITDDVATVSLNNVTCFDVWANALIFRER